MMRKVKRSKGKVHEVILLSILLNRITQTAGSSPSDANSSALSAADLAQVTLTRIRCVVTSTHSSRRCHVGGGRFFVTMTDTAARRLAAIIIHDTLGTERTELPVT